MTDYQTIRKLIHRLREADTKWQVTAQREMAEPGGVAGAGLATAMFEPL